MNARLASVTEMWRDVWEGLRSQPRRIALSMLAIASGLSALTALVAVLSGLDARSRAIVRELGADVLGIVSEPTAEAAPVRQLRIRHASLLARNLSGDVVSTVRRYEVPTFGSEERLSVVATDENLIRVRGWEILDGRFLDQTDLKNRQRHAVISEALSESWAWRVGDLVLVGNSPFRVVGVVKIGTAAEDLESSDARLALGERVVIIPRSIPPSWSLGRERPPDGIDAIFIKVVASESLASVVLRARRILSHPELSVGRISWITPDSLIHSIMKLQRSLRWIAGTIVSLVLMLGGVTLASLMITNVEARIREIGLRRSIGATGRDIALLFMFEGCLVTVCAGAVATMVAHLALLLARSSLPVPLELSWKTALIPLLVAILLALVSSYWPAKMASQIAPSAALRCE